MKEHACAYEFGFDLCVCVLVRKVEVLSFGFKYVQCVSDLIALGGSQWWRHTCVPECLVFQCVGFLFVCFRRGRLARYESHRITFTRARALHFYGRNISNYARMAVKVFVP